MTGYFEIDATWPEPVAPDARDIAEISIRVGSDYLTRIADVAARTNRDFFRGSATTLAFWLADNWWRLRCEPIDPSSSPSTDWRVRHELSSASGGTLWPPLMIYSGGERVIIAPSLSRRPPLEPLQYLDNRVRMITAPQFEDGTDHFFNLVLAACAMAADAANLEELVRQLVKERTVPELAAWRRLEACLGYDADEAPQEVVEALLKLAPSLGAEEVVEAAAAHPGPEAPIILERVVEASRESALEVDFGLADRIEPALGTPAYASPWKLAESAAAQVRKILAMSPGPLSDKAFADMLLTRWEELKQATATARKLPYAARLSVKGSVGKLAIQSKSAVDRRFEVARLLGDAIWTRNSTFGLVSEARTDRQKFQRAFAQSLLCPVDDLRPFVDFANPKAAQMEQAAKSFGVHPNVIRNLLAYKGIVRETLEDQLERA